MNAGQTATQTLATLGGTRLHLSDGRFDANQNFSIGQVLALIVASAVNTVMTFTITGTPTAGIATYSFNGKLVAIPYNCTAAVLTSLLAPIFGASNIAVGGGPFPGTALTVTFQGVYAGLNVVLPTLSSSTLNAGATIAVATTTPNVPQNKMVKWDPTKVTSPATVLSVSAAGTGTWVAGTYSISYTWVNTNGETLASPATTLALSGSNAIRVAAINAAGIPDYATALNVYVNGVLAKQIAVTTPGTAGNVAQTDVAFYDTSVQGGPPPIVNTALIYTDGRQNFVGLANEAITTDGTGAISFTAQGAVNAFPGKAGKGSSGVVTGGLVGMGAIVGVSDWPEFLRQTGARIIKGSIATNDAVFALQPLGVNQ